VDECGRTSGCRHLACQLSYFHGAHSSRSCSTIYLYLGINTRLRKWLNSTSNHPCLASGFQASCFKLDDNTIPDITSFASILSISDDSVPFLYYFLLVNSSSQEITFSMHTKYLTQQYTFSPSKLFILDHLGNVRFLMPRFWFKTNL